MVLVMLLYSVEMLRWLYLFEHIMYQLCGVSLCTYINYNPLSAKHMDFLGVQVAWVTGPWFLSIFINMLPWESGQVLCNSLVLSLRYILILIHLMFGTSPLNWTKHAYQIVRIMRIPFYYFLNVTYSCHVC